MFSLNQICICSSSVSEPWKPVSTKYTVLPSSESRRGAIGISLIAGGVPFGFTAVTLPPIEPVSFAGSAFFGKDSALVEFVKRTGDIPSSDKSLRLFMASLPSRTNSALDASRDGLARAQVTPPQLIAISPIHELLVVHDEFGVRAAAQFVQ